MIQFDGMRTVSADDKAVFQAIVWDYYDRHGRHDLPWRRPITSEVPPSPDPYQVLVSEFMLQQTQVKRVIPKFLAFIERYPTIQSLAQSTLGDVIAAWSGLGYNRRAKFLWQTARQIIQDYDGHIPHQVDQLVKLPGIGVNTAGAIMTYAFNEPVVFIETNIRTVYFHHFFPGQRDIDDSLLVPLIEQTRPTGNVRKWYWALMDYGSFLKQEHNLVTASRHYVKQSRFEGSKRQIRGAVLRLLASKPYEETELYDLLNDERLSGVLDDLMKEGFIERRGSFIRLPA